MVLKSTGKVQAYRQILRFFHAIVCNRTRYVYDFGSNCRLSKVKLDNSVAKLSIIFIKQ